MHKKRCVSVVFKKYLILLCLPLLPPLKKIGKQIDLFTHTPNHIMIQPTFGVLIIFVDCYIFAQVYTFRCTDKYSDS